MKQQCFSSFIRIRRMPSAGATSDTWPDSLSMGGWSQRDFRTSVWAAALGGFVETRSCLPCPSPSAEVLFRWTALRTAF